MVFGESITGVILAGGSNRRFPVLKAFIKVDGERIIERILRIYRELFNEILISTNTPEYYFYLGVPLVGDLYPDGGPMAGILSSIINARGEWVFVSACDMPFIKKEMIEYIIQLKVDSPVVVCKVANTLHPLFGLFHCSVAEAMEEYIRAGRKDIKSFLREINTYIIGADKIKKIDPQAENFVNINTLEDYNKFRGGRLCLD